MYRHRRNRTERVTEMEDREKVEKAKETMRGMTKMVFLEACHPAALLLLALRS